MTESAPFDFTEAEPAPEPTPEAPADPAAEERSAVEQAETVLRENERALVPDEGSSPEDWSKFYDRLGRPAEPDGYQLDDLEVPESLRAAGFDPADFREDLHATGLNQRQAVDLLNRYGRRVDHMVKDHLAADAARTQEAEAGLKLQWGEQGFERNRTRAEHALRDLAADEADELAELRLAGDGRNLGDHPAIVRLFAAVADALEGNPSPMPSASATGVGEHPAPAPSSRRDKAERELRRLKTDPAFIEAWRDRNHPQHHDAVNRWHRLHEQAEE